MNTQLMNFLKEILNRLITRSPKFFFVLQVISGAVALAGYVPAMLLNWFNIEMPPHLVHFCKDISKYAIGFIGATSLTAESKPTAVTHEGSVVKKLDEEKYPFTSLVEQKKAEKHEVPVIKDPLNKQ